MLQDKIFNNIVPSVPLVARAHHIPLDLNDLLSQSNQGLLLKGVVAAKPLLLALT